MKIGTYYYPEQWPASDWTRDFDRIASMGLQIVHLAEFAWGTIEPRESDYQLDWIQTCLELARERNLDVILCTPTAVVPVWMVDRDPSILFQGIPFGGRRHANHLHPLYRERSAKVVEAMARRFGDHPSVIGWQIDNEFNGPMDQSDISHRAFQHWLEARYGTIEKLNDAWGCAFWNTFYTSFSQVRFPSSTDPAYRNPHQCLDGMRFWAWSFADYSRLQADILKKYVGHRWITTNFMPFHQNTDPRDFSDQLSLFSWDTYPITGWGKEFKDERFRMADPAGVGFMHDQMKSYNGRWALMEVQPGQVNWTGVPVRLMPGAVRQLLWQAIAHQCEFITVYRFRQPRFGIEMWHDGLVTWDATTPSPGGREFSQVIDEVRSLTSQVEGVTCNDHRPLEADPTHPSIGLYHEQDQLFAMVTQPQAKAWSQNKLVVQYHSAIERLGLGVKVFDRHATVEQLGKTKILVAPAVQIADEAMIDTLRKYVEAGGHLIITARSFITDLNNRAPLGAYGHRLFELIGARISSYDALPEETFGEVDFLKRKHRWQVWSEQVTPTTASVIGTYADQFYAGAAAITENRLGAGRVTFVGAIDQGSLADAVLEHVADQHGLPVTILPKRTRLHRMREIDIFLNFSERSVDAPMPEGATLLVGQKRCESGGVTIWRRPKGT